MSPFIGYWKSKDQIVILHKSVLCTEVEFDHGFRYIQAELGPADDFETICPLETEWDNMFPISVTIKLFNNGSTDESMAMKIVVTGLTEKMLKNKATTVLDVGNYIYRKFGIQYEMCPEYSNVDEPKNSLTFFVSQGRFKEQEHLIQFISRITGESEKLVRLCAVDFCIEIKKAGLE